MTILDKQILLQTARIAGGGEAPPHSFPYQVAVVWRNTSNAFCGGAILSKKFVFTAAHCVDRGPAGRPITKKNFQIIAGEHDLDNDHDNATTHNIKNITIHPKWQ